MKLRSNPFASHLLQSPASRTTRLIAATALTLTLAPSAMAASQTWDGGGSSTTTPGAATALNTAANWTGALPSGDGSSMIFESTTNLSLSASTSGFGNSSTVQFNLQQNGTGNLTLDSTYATTSGNSFRFDQINLDGDAGNLTFGNGSGTAFNVVLGKNQAAATAPVLHTWTNSNAASTVTFETEAGFTLGPSSQGRILTLAGNGNWNFKNIIPTSSALLSFTKTGSGTATFSGANTFTGATKITGGSIILGNALALQNSAWDTTGAGSGVGLNVTGYTTPTLGGLNGSVDLATAVTAGYSSVTNLTLNPQTGISATYSGVIANGASGMTLTKTGAGTQTLSGTNSYSGTTSVNAGTLIVNGTHSGTGAVSVASGAKLGGGGILAASTTISGILAPGNSIGTLTIGNDVTWQGAATVGSATNWQYELGLSNSSDLLNLTGASSEFIKNTSVGSFFNFDFLGSAATGTFTLVDWESTVDLTGDAFGTNFLLTDFTYSNLGGTNTGTFGFSGTSLQFTVVPEPCAALIGGIGMLMLFRRRRSVMV